MTPVEGKIRLTLQGYQRMEPQAYRSDRLSLARVSQRKPFVRDSHWHERPHPVPNPLNSMLLNDLTSMSAIPRPPLSSSNSETEASNVLENGMRLDLETLQGFEAVSDRFQDWGVRFRNAIALQPSNPAYPPKLGTMVAIPGPKSGWMEIWLARPARTVSCYVTSSRRIVLTAFNDRDEEVASTELSEANLADSNSRFSPNTQLTLQTQKAEIYRINFSAFDGQFSVDDFYFQFD